MAHVLERRKEQRQPAEETVRLFSQALDSAGVSAQLIDKSSEGFRAIHDCHEMMSGEVVRFAWPGESGRARVLWTRIQSERAESGFWIESRDS